MANLSMCRVCLGEDIRLLSIVGTHLQEMYESLVLMPVATTDGRSVMACYICRARLQNCYELRKSCLQSEELFTQMLSCNEFEKAKLQAVSNKKILTMHNVVHFSVGHVPGVDADNVGVEALKCEVKDEPNDSEDIDEDLLEESSVSDNVQCADLDEDFAITIKEEQIGHWTGDSTAKEPTQGVQTTSEDLTSSNLNEDECVQDTFRKLHEVTAADTTDDNKDRPVTVMRSESVQYPCDTCRQYYSSKWELERHIRLCSDVCKKDFSRENSTSANTDTDQNPNQCNICKKQFTLKSNLKAHLRLHTGEKLYHCNECKKQFSMKSSLRKHIRTHTGEKPHQCFVCKKLYLDKGDLNRHMLTHTGEKPHKCNMCKKQFSLKFSLTTHMRIHTGEKPYKCNECKKQFSLKGNLTTHMCIHTVEKPYHCNVCKKQFSQKDGLKTHMRIHTGEKPHQCNICKKQYSEKRYLTQHLCIQAGEKPHHCNVCKKQFARKTNLTVHLRVHTGEKPHKCNMCKKQYSDKRYLTKHMLLHTSE